LEFPGGKPRADVEVGFIEEGSGLGLKPKLEYMFGKGGRARG
jgi:hypothetical protein